MPSDNRHTARAQTMTRALPFIGPALAFVAMLVIAGGASVTAMMMMM